MAKDKHTNTRTIHDYHTYQPGTEAYTREDVLGRLQYHRVLLLSHSNLRTIFYLCFQSQLAMTSHHCVKPMRNKNMYNLNFN